MNRKNRRLLESFVKELIALSSISKQHAEMAYYADQSGLDPKPAAVRYNQRFLMK